MRRLALLVPLLVLSACLDRPAEEADDSAPTLTEVAPAPADADRPSAPPASAPSADRVVESVGPDGRPEVVLYVTEWCPYCAQARDYMAAEGVPHRVVDIEKDAAGAREYAARGGDGGIPLVAVGNRTMNGWSAEHARGLLDAAGYD